MIKHLRRLFSVWLHCTVRDKPQVPAKWKIDAENPPMGDQYITCLRCKRLVHRKASLVVQSPWTHKLPSKTST